MKISSTGKTNLDRCMSGICKVYMGAIVVLYKYIVLCDIICSIYIPCVLKLKQNLKHRSGFAYRIHSLSMCFHLFHCLQ